MRLGPQALWPKMRAAFPEIHQASRKAALPPFISVSLRETDPFPFACLMHRGVIISEDCPPFPVDVNFQYSAEQPFGVLTTLRACGTEAEWTLSREQLIRGLRRPAGWGDVAVRPVARNGGQDVILMRLGPASNHVEVEVGRSVLDAWLQETLRLIPRGSEAQYLMLDQLIDSILGADG
ncbi:SsgA family sporulation/cell division regulator [Streptomyces aureus]